MQKWTLPCKSGENAKPALSAHDLRLARRAKNRRVRPDSSPELEPKPVNTKKAAIRMDGIATATLEAEIEDWLLWCKSERHSKRTEAIKRVLFGRLLNWLIKNNHEFIGKSELVEFFAQLRNPRTGEQLRPSAEETYHRYYRAFFNFLVSNGKIETSPMAGIAKPRIPEDEISIIEPEQLDTFLDALKAGQSAKERRRNRAIALLLYDTFIRAEELCNIKFKDLDMQEYRIRVLGKGGKYRPVYFGVRTMRALWQYLQGESRHPNDALFLACSGRSAGKPMTPSGITRMISKAGKRTGIKGIRWSAHTLRHSGATLFLRNGGSLKACQKQLGHTTWRMTQRYNNLSEADLREQHRRSSPVDRIGKH